MIKPEPSAVGMKPTILMDFKSYTERANKRKQGSVRYVCVCLWRCLSNVFKNTRWCTFYVAPLASLACFLLAHVTMATISCVPMVVVILGGHLTKDVLQDTHAHTYTLTHKHTYSAWVCFRPFIKSDVVRSTASSYQISCFLFLSDAHGHWTRGH